MYNAEEEIVDGNMGIWVWAAVSSMLEAELSLTGSWCFTSKCFYMFLKAISEHYLSFA